MTDFQANSCFSAEKPWITTDQIIPFHSWTEVTLKENYSIVRKKSFLWYRICKLFLKEVVMLHQDVMTGYIFLFVLFCTLLLYFWILHINTWSYAHNRGRTGIHVSKAFGCSHCKSCLKFKWNKYQHILSWQPSSHKIVSLKSGDSSPTNSHSR